MGKLFGTDGIRGVANIYPMTSEIAMQIGRAIAFIVKNNSSYSISDIQNPPSSKTR